MSGLTVFSRHGCHLCEQLVEELEPLCRGAGVSLHVLDVDAQSDWRERFGLRVPVVCDGVDELSGWPLDRARVEVWLRQYRA